MAFATVPTLSSGWTHQSWTVFGTCKPSKPFLPQAGLGSVFSGQEKQPGTPSLASAVCLCAPSPIPPSQAPVSYSFSPVALASGTSVHLFLHLYPPPPTSFPVQTCTCLRQRNLEPCVAATGSATMIWVLLSWPCIFVPRAPSLLCRPHSRPESPSSGPLAVQCGSLA